MAPLETLPVWIQFLILGTVVNLTFSSADVLTVLFASSLKQTLSRSHRWRALGARVCGSLLIGLGLKLSLERG